MPHNIMVSDELYDRLKPLTNNLGGRHPKKMSFSEVIKRALDDQERFEKRYIKRMVIK